MLALSRASAFDDDVFLRLRADFVGWSPCAPLCRCQPTEMCSGGRAMGELCASRSSVVAGREREKENPKCVMGSIVCTVARTAWQQRLPVHGDFRRGAHRDSCMSACVLVHIHAGWSLDAFADPCWVKSGALVWAGRLGVRLHGYSAA